MENLEFEWDDDKAVENRRKHGIDFKDAVGVFFDPWSIERVDERELGEDRFHVIGLSQGRVLFVAYTERDGIIRLISARPASRQERRSYEDTRKR